MGMFARTAGESDRVPVRLIAAAGVVVLVLGVLAWVAGDAIRAGTLLRDALVAPADLAAEVVVTSSITDEGVPVTVYRPVDEDGPLPGFVLIHGAIGQGPDDPRLVDLAQSLAARGATVAAPRLDALAEFRLDQGDLLKLADTVAWLAGQESLVADGQVAIFGISIGGSYGLLTAARPDVRDQVSAVMVFGGYDDLGELLTQWLTDPADTDAVLDPVREGRRLVLLGNVEATVRPADVPAVTACLEALLDDLPCEITTNLGPRAERMVTAAKSEEALDEETAAALLEPLRRELRVLSPGQMSQPPAAPVYLLHAEGDPVVPTGDTGRVAVWLSAQGGDVETHITEVFEHVDAAGAPSLIESWPLLRFVGRFLDDAGM